MVGRDVRGFYNEVRESLKSVEIEIVNHPLVVDAFNGRLGVEAIKRFVINQWYIVNHDLRSLALMLSRARDMEELSYFRDAVDADYRALQGLADLLRELGIEPRRPSDIDVSPQATAYTHYISWLAHYASIGVIAFAFAVNFPIWGEASTRFGDALGSRYGYKSLGFFQVFRPPYDQFIERSLAIASKYYPDDKEFMRQAAKMIQHYEKLFWDSIYSHRT
jgi:thiaminase